MRCRSSPSAGRSSSVRIHALAREETRYTCLKTLGELPRGQESGKRPLFIATPRADGAPSPRLQASSSEALSSQSKPPPAPKTVEDPGSMGLRTLGPPRVRLPLREAAAKKEKA